jgi:putative ABC transport system permease protein
VRVRGGGPPRLARALLDWLLPGHDSGAATGDLDEEYTRFVRADRGRLAADLWYWRQVLLSAPRLLARKRSGFVTLLGSLVGDARLAARVLGRRPAFTFAAVATLALGLGVNTTVFGVVHAVLVRPLPFADADRLVRPIPGELFYLNSAEANRLEERMTTLESFAAWGRALFLFTGDGEAEEVRGARVAWNHFHMLGVDPLLGRTFERADAASDEGIVLGYGLWVRRFGGDPDIVGTAIDVNGRPMTVLGVLGPDHVAMEFDWEAWRTLPLDPERAAGMGLAGNGRLRPGVQLTQARDELRRVVPEIWAEDGYIAGEDERAGLEVVSLRTWILGDARPALLVLWGAVGLVLLLACANVANLLVAHGGSRTREFAVRAALGGARTRVAGQLLVEVLLLSVVGGVVAVLASTAALGWLSGRLPAEMPRAADASLSAPIVLFNVVSTLLVALTTGVVPALRASSSGIGGFTRGGRGVSSDRGRTRIRSWLIASEMAFAVVLVVGATLMLRTLSSLSAVDPGFHQEGVMTLRPSPPASRYPAGPELEAYYVQLTQALARLPGVRSVGAIQFLPMTPGGWWTGYLPEGRNVGDGENEYYTAMRVVREGYFETMQIPLLAGRSLTAADGLDEVEAVAIVNETFAREGFAGLDPLGRTVYVDETPLRIVGVVGDVRQSDLRTASHAEMYVHFGRVPWQRMHMVMRIDGDESATLATVTDAVRAVDPDVAILGPRMMDEVVGSTLGSARMVTGLLALFGLVGLGLGAVGVYGVAAQSVAERRREIGIRIALGAEAGAVASSTILGGLIPVSAGLAVGLLGAFAGGGLLDGLLFGVASSDVRTMVTAPSVLFLVALLALAAPAVRASRVDPVRTLRQE